MEVKDLRKWVDLCEKYGIDDFRSQLELSREVYSLEHRYGNPNYAEYVYTDGTVEVEDFGFVETSETNPQAWKSEATVVVTGFPSFVLHDMDYGCRALLIDDDADPDYVAEMLAVFKPKQQTAEVHDTPFYYLVSDFTEVTA